MPRPGGPGRPGSTVIPPGWEAHHRPTAEGTFTALCEISADPVGQGPWNDDIGDYDPAPRVVLYSNLPCRVQELRQPQEARTGDQRVTSHDYLVPVPASTTNVAVGHQIKVTGFLRTGEGDPSLLGRPLVVTDVQRGSTIFQRDLICIDHLG
jgi:hypothetical protein